MRPSRVSSVVRGSCSRVSRTVVAALTLAGKLLPWSMRAGLCVHRQLITHQLLGRQREERLTPVGRRQKPGDPVQGRAEVVPVPPRVKRHAHQRGSGLDPVSIYQQCPPGGEGYIQGLRSNGKRGARLPGQETGSVTTGRPFRRKYSPASTTAPPTIVRRPGLSESTSQARSAATTGSARMVPEMMEACT
jgi:hypothetical protein